MASFNGVNLGSAPFVGISDEMVLWGGRYCAIKRVIVQGKIYECGSGLNTGKDILSSISQFQDAALNGYGSFSAGGFSVDHARCESLEITNSDYLGAEYRAEFLAYPDDFFANVVGILEPTDSINVTIEKNGLIKVTRTASARAANDKGFNEVFSWLQSLNLESVPDISDYGFEPLTISAPKTVSQTTDRINGLISVEVTFIQNEGADNDFILDYAVDVQYDDKSGIYSATINGSLEGHTKSDIESVASAVESIGLFELAQDALDKAGANNALNPEPINASFSENDELDSVNFSITYNTYPVNHKPFFSFTIDYDYIKDIVTVTISGTITFDKTPVNDRDSLINGLIEGYDFRSLCEQEFNKKSPSKNNPLNLENPVSYSITVNKGADISADVSVSYNNEDIFPGAKHLSLDYDIEINPSSKVNIPVQFLNGGGGYFDYQADRRGSASIRGTVISKDSGKEGSIKSEMLGVLDSAMSNFGPEDEILTESNVTFSTSSDNGFVYEFEIKKEAILNF